MKTCSFLGCELPEYVGDCCEGHFFERWRRGGIVPPFLGKDCSPLRKRYPAEYREWRKMYYYKGEGGTNLRWTGRGGFERFLRDVGVRPSGYHFLARLNRFKGFSPLNTHWMTKIEAVELQQSQDIAAHNGMMRRGIPETQTLSHMVSEVERLARQKGRRGVGVVRHETAEFFPSISAAADAAGVSNQVMGRVVKNPRRRLKKFHWRMATPGEMTAYYAGYDMNSEFVRRKLAAVPLKTAENVATLSEARRLVKKEEKKRIKKERAYWLRRLARRPRWN